MCESGGTCSTDRQNSAMETTVSLFSNKGSSIGQAPRLSTVLTVHKALEQSRNDMACGASGSHRWVSSPLRPLGFLHQIYSAAPLWDQSRALLTEARGRGMGVVRS